MCGRPICQQHSSHESTVFRCRECWTSESRVRDNGFEASRSRLASELTRVAKLIPASNSMWKYEHSIVGSRTKVKDGRLTMRGGKDIGPSVAMRRPKVADFDTGDSYLVVDGMMYSGRALGEKSVQLSGRGIPAEAAAADPGKTALDLERLWYVVVNLDPSAWHPDWLPPVY